MCIRDSVKAVWLCPACVPMRVSMRVRVRMHITCTWAFRLAFRAAPQVLHSRSREQGARLAIHEGGPASRAASGASLDYVLAA
eukprot:5337475-Alexandrium_andersonii.AAC.1